MLSEQMMKFLLGKDLKPEKDKKQETCTEKQEKEDKFVIYSYSRFVTVPVKMIN